LAAQGQAPQEVAGEEGVFWRDGTDRWFTSRLAGRKRPGVSIYGIYR